MTKHHALCGLLSGLLLLAVTLSSAAAAIVTVPPGLSPGDQYRLVFVTDALIDATSSDISVYNAFVHAEAVAAGLNSIMGQAVTWTAIGSTATVDARDNTGTNPSVNGIGVPIFGLDGVKIVDNNSDLWDGFLDFGIYLTPNENSELGFVWTGTEFSGVGDDRFALGSIFGLCGTGRPGLTDPTWVDDGVDPFLTPYSIYGLSELITAIPEPSRGVLITLASVLALLQRRRTRSPRDYLPC